MECNRDEAQRAKDIAERRFREKDIRGAKKFALKAQTLSPQLDGISQLLATLDVYVSSEKKINGETDWYGILGANPLDNENVIRKKYHKLALILHPDKNQAEGADGAFDLISRAWNLLSDKDKRSAYDKILRIQPQSGGSSVPPTQNGFYSFAQGSNMKAPTDSSHSIPPVSHKQKTACAPVSSHKEKPSSASQSHKHKSSSVPSESHTQKPPTVPVTSHKRKRVPSFPDSPQEPKQNTFWTACHGCSMQYEYPRMYINRNLLCPNCQEPFFSFEIAPPPPAKREASAHHQKARKTNSMSGIKKSANPNVKAGKSGDSDHHNKFQWAPFSKISGAASAAQAASMVQHAYEKVKREREEAQATTKREEALLKKKNACDIVDNIVSHGESDAAERKTDEEDLDIDGDGDDNLFWLLKQVKVCKTMKPSRSKSFSNVQNLHLLAMKAKKEIRKRVNEWNSASVSKSVEANVSYFNKTNGKEKGKNYPVINGAKKNQNNHTPGASCGNFDRMPMSMQVTDSDFHDFDKYRSEKCFDEVQVWAAYDNYDGMPRYYGMVHRVISLNPFKIRISWLNFKSNGELGAPSCIGSALSKTCGDFTIGKQDIVDSVDFFSHKVKWTKGPGGCVQIYPRIGDVWCLYKNWCPEWNELTSDEVIHQYDIVQVLDDDCGEGGVAVIPLVKVVGFKTVFRPHLDPTEIQRIPNTEIFRFSHNIPSYRMTGREALNGCLELDPAATPSEHLHVIAVDDFSNLEIMESEEKYNEQTNNHTLVEEEEDSAQEIY